jgi:chromosome segregation ATPase
MDNFNLKQFLVENKLTENSKLNETWTKERKTQDPEGYAKYLEKQKQRLKQNYEKLKQDPKAYAKYLEKANQYYKTNPEKIKQAAKQYYEKNPEKVKQRLKQSYKKLKQDPEAYAKHLEKNKQKAKQSYEKIKQDPEAYAKHLERLKQYREKLKQDPEAYAKYLEKLKQYREKNPEKVKQRLKQDYEKLKQDPEAYAKHLEKSKQYANQYYEKNQEKVKQRLKQSLEKLKQDPEAYAKHSEKNRQKTKQNYEKLKQDYDNYIKQSSDFFYNTITNNPSPELKNIKNNPKLLTKLYSEFIKKAKQQYKAKNKDFSFMVAENSKLNEIKATPKNTGLTIPKQLATDLVNQTQPDFEEDEYIVISTPVSEVNPKFIKYLKSLPTDNDYPNQSGIATFDITYKGIEWKIMFYLVYADANYDIYDEDMVVFELS